MILFTRMPRYAVYTRLETVAGDWPGLGMYLDRGDLVSIQTSKSGRKDAAGSPVPRAINTYLLPSPAEAGEGEKKGEDEEPDYPKPDREGGGMGKGTRREGGRESNRQPGRPLSAKCGTPRPPTPIR